jgi:hypothetical protein
VHASGQDPTKPLYPSGTNSHSCSSNQIDTKAKFDLFRPFAPAGVYNPDTRDTSLVNCRALHVLDCFTVWDPSNDGIDNDGDGAVDDEDTGCQPSDKAGPEVRVFGMLDLNQISEPVWATVWPDNKDVRAANQQGYPIRFMYMMRQAERKSSYNEGIGPFETIGDLLRADDINRYPGLWLSGGWWGPGAGALPEGGFRIYNKPTAFDNDGDGITDERDERDMIFTWIANFLTTRANVFGMEVHVDLCEPPDYPKRGGVPVRLPYKACATSRVYARKQALGILDRSTCLRIGPDGECDFTGPVEMRMFRFGDDVLVY